MGKEEKEKGWQVEWRKWGEVEIEGAWWRSHHTGIR